ncbi:stabilizer of axonemal microtubules 1-like [Strongylocentrotus purpuratus]|uniref:Stabilizer of axonemal microtubules 2 n=1 Tax=Strongylocentrotus purpuratus TaxID=7668 RepID=A0A7M7LVY9_STRPU|nr:stabilizer of axonemal microtubules 1-like [Strongylocentrotus purpuratus]|eukprot:XP_011669647.1 PREDICTED: protein FAM154A-like [Strongylocentrotus purpuratus]
MSQDAAIRNRISNIKSAKDQMEVYSSEYQSKYREWPLTRPREAIRPKVAKGVSGGTSPADMVSCTHRVFVHHELKGSPRSYKPKHEFTAPDVKMETNTTYNVEYHEKKAKPRPSPYKPGEMVMDNKPFNTKTVYQVHFKEFTREELDACNVEVKPHHDNLGKEEKEAFNGQSTAQDSFRPPGKVLPATLLKPTEKSHIDPTQPFQTETTHRAEFTAKTIPQRQTPIPPNKCIEPKREKSQFLTVFTRDFVNHKTLAPVESYKPKRPYRRNPSKFDGRTTNRMSYQPIPFLSIQARPAWANRDKAVVVSKAQRAKLDLKTSYQDAYGDPNRIIPMDKCRGVPYKLPCNLGRPSAGAPMEVTTSYKVSYVPWEKAKRTETYKLERPYTIPVAPFYGQSTTGTHYLGIPAPPSKSFKPSTRPRSGPGKMSNVTTYRATFGRRAASCPPPHDAERSASTLQASRTERTIKTPTVPPNTAANNSPKSFSSNAI